MRQCFVPFAVIGITALNLSCHQIRGPVTPQPLNVMSFNIRYNNPDDGANAWPDRKDLVAGVIRFHQADLIGVQEALKDQMNDLAQLLPEFGAIGVGRDDGGENEKINFTRCETRVMFRCRRLTARAGVFLALARRLNARSSIMSL
ncbi:MAG: hypothetical protein ONB46_16235 [candidate division KSB1 bacterium]|nr:hypothetical protein [candidate division KSB1 bacterium]MDZ7367294.1 hypothetical protein [candidate division KSB1 bacterium]MDZ7405867.1 hypothetical protein [candidate division KSB1 bacterium]